MTTMPNFIPAHYRQDLLLAINLEDQLQHGTAVCD